MSAEPAASIGALSVALDPTAAELADPDVDCE
jgi:hypothetical protein